MPKSDYVILSRRTDQNGLYLAWSARVRDWVEYEEATHYGKEVFSFPPRELPLGAWGIKDVVQSVTLYPRMGE